MMEKNMQLSFTNKTKFGVILLTVLMACTVSAFAGKKTYTENEFLDNFSGKSKKAILQKLGEPAKKEMSVKPSGAGAFAAKVGKEDKSKPVKVEMWYYNHIVNYDPKNTYKETEITFVNDRAMNIAFFNNR